MADQRMLLPELRGGGVLVMTGRCKSFEPRTFVWVKPEWFTWLLGLLMFSVGHLVAAEDCHRTCACFVRLVFSGLTTSVEDFRSSMKSWLAVVAISIVVFVECGGRWL